MVDDEGLRLAVLTGFAATGRAPDLAALAHGTGRTVDDVRAWLVRLHAARHLVLDPSDPDVIVLAHPFASTSFGFSVMGARTLWWGGCAWDSFALPHLLADEPPVLVATTCPGCGAALAWVVGRDAPPPGDEVAHFATPMARVWDDVVHACAHQRVFCGTDCVHRWLARSGVPEGYVMDLPTLWRLASRWYEGRLVRGYRRREPAQAAAYFGEVGLRGAFWGLPD